MRIFHRSFPRNRLIRLFALFALVLVLLFYAGYTHESMGFQLDKASNNTTQTNVNTTGVSPLPAKMCSPMKQILFLKTHKTGSSTMANILFRYGDSRDLTFVLGGDTLLGWPKKFRITFPYQLYGHPDILCSHTRFNKKPMNWLFPPEISKYVTILRNPVDNFESVFNFARLGRAYGLGDNPDSSLERFLNNPKPIPYSDFNVKKLMMHLSRNPMMFDLGLDVRHFQSSTAVNEYIQFLDKEFDLVMIMDYFDESLVLMKRMLCWENEK